MRIVKHLQSALDLTILGYGNEAEYFNFHKDNADLILGTSGGVEEVEVPGDFPLGAEVVINPEKVDQNVLKIMSRDKYELATKTEDRISATNNGFTYQFPYQLS